MADRPNVMIIPGFNLEQARKKVKTHCCFCDTEAEVPESKAPDYICNDCKEFFKEEMSDVVHETAKMFRRTKDSDGERK